MRHRCVVTAVLLACGVSVAVQVCSGRSESALDVGKLVVVASSKSTHLDVQKLRFGKLKPNESVLGSLTLHNPSSEQLVAARVESSCPCIRVIPELLRVGPGESMTVGVEFDPAEEPDFRGTLGVNLTWKSTEGIVLLQHTVELTVVNSSTEVVVRDEH